MQLLISVERKPICFKSHFARDKLLAEFSLMEKWLTQGYKDASFFFYHMHVFVVNVPFGGLFQKLENCKTKNRVPMNTFLSFFSSRWCSFPSAALRVPLQSYPISNLNCAIAQWWKISLYFVIEISSYFLYLWTHGSKYLKATFNAKWVSCPRIEASSLILENCFE